MLQDAYIILFTKVLTILRLGTNMLNFGLGCHSPYALFKVVTLSNIFVVSNIWSPINLRPSPKMYLFPINNFIIQAYPLLIVGEGGWRVLLSYWLRSNSSSFLNTAILGIEKLFACRSCQLMPLAHHMTVHFFPFQELGHVRQIMRFKSLVHVCGILFQPTWDRPNHWTFSRVNLKLTCSINGFAYVLLVYYLFCFCLYFAFILVFLFSAVMFARALYKCLVVLYCIV